MTLFSSFSSSISSLSREIRAKNQTIRFKNPHLVLLLNSMSDVYRKCSQPSGPTEASEIDLIDFLHHIVLYEGQGGPVQRTSKPKLEILTLCSKLIEYLQPDVQYLLSRLKTDPNSSIYAASPPKLVQNPS